MAYHEHIESKVTLTGGPNQLTLKSLWMTCGKGERPTKFVIAGFRENYLGSALNK